MIMVRAFLTATDFDFEEFGQYLSPARRAAIAEFKDARIRAEKTSASLLLDYALTKYGYTGKLPARTAAEKNGKPYLKNGPRFNLSHSGGFAACIVSGTPVGIDIEKISDKINLIARKFPDFVKNKDIESLTRFWTMSEALFKFYGKTAAALYKGLPSLVFNDYKDGIKANSQYGHIVYLHNFIYDGYSVSFASLSCEKIQLEAAGNNDIAFFLKNNY